MCLISPLFRSYTNLTKPGKRVIGNFGRLPQKFYLSHPMSIRHSVCTGLIGQWEKIREKNSTKCTRQKGGEGEGGGGGGIVEEK